MATKDFLYCLFFSPVEPMYTMLIELNNARTLLIRQSFTYPFTSLLISIAIISSDTSVIINIKTNVHIMCYYQHSHWAWHSQYWFPESRATSTSNQPLSLISLIPWTNHACNINNYYITKFSRIHEVLDLMWYFCQQTTRLYTQR